MRRRRLTSRSRMLLLAITDSLVFAMAFVANVAFAREVETPHAPSVPCAYLERFGGQVELLDASRTQVVETVVKAGIPCGGWVSTEEGWARLRYRDGYTVHLGSGTFAQVLDGQGEGQGPGDQLLLYKGQIYGKAGVGNRELRVLTANARARLGKGAGVVIYDSSEEETQLIAAEDSALLENRFQAAAFIRLQGGEATALSLKALRVVPSTPRAVNSATLKAKLGDLHVDDKDQSHALAVAKERQDRKFATVIPVKEPPAPAPTVPNDGVKIQVHGQDEVLAHKTSGGKGEKQRAPAGLVSDYSRHPARPEDAKLKNHMIRKMVAGHEAGEKILFPDKFYGRPQSVKVEVDDPLAKARAQQQRETDAERSRLMEELSQIRVE